jgi:hypothetical protein
MAETVDLYLVQASPRTAVDGPAIWVAGLEGEGSIHRAVGRQRRRVRALAHDTREQLVPSPPQGAIATRG